MPPTQHTRRLRRAVRGSSGIRLISAAALALGGTATVAFLPSAPLRRLRDGRVERRQFASADPLGASEVSTVSDATAAASDLTPPFAVGGDEAASLIRPEARLSKTMRQTCRKFDMIENGDHIMVCVSGGKDSATMLRLLMNLRERLARPGGTDFRITAVHLDQKQPGYDGAPLVKWLDSLGVQYRILSEDTYSIVKSKTPESKTHCSLCSRLRRGILYTVAHDLGCNKLALGHHGDDAIETLLLNAIHAGQLKSMPARYYSAERHVHVIRPLIGCSEGDIREYAIAMGFPVLPCNLCGSQPDAQRTKVKMLVGTLDALSPDARRNFVRAMGDVRPSHLLDVGLREACGLDGATGVAIEPERARLVHGIVENGVGDGKKEEGGDRGNVEPSRQELPLSFIENLL